MQQTLLGIAIVLLLAWLYVRRRHRSAETEAPVHTRKPKDTTYHAVSIQFEKNACDAAKGMGGRRFLASAAPRLPLPECNALECRCRFAHHDDRRTGKDRRNPFARAGFGHGTGKFQTERREKPDRRERDDSDDFSAY